MAGMDDRQKAFENKFARDEELRFRANARRNKLLGLWVAERLGKTGAEAEDYAREVVKADFQEPGEEDVFRKVRGDLDQAGVAVSDEELRRAMVEKMAVAVEQVQSQ